MRKFWRYGVVICLFVLAILPMQAEALRGCLINDNDVFFYCSDGVCGHGFSVLNDNCSAGAEVRDVNVSADFIQDARTRQPTIFQDGSYRINAVGHCVYEYSALSTGGRDRCMRALTAFNGYEKLEFESDLQHFSDLKRDYVYRTHVTKAKSIVSSIAMLTFSVVIALAPSFLLWRDIRRQRDSYLRRNYVKATLLFAALLLLTSIILSFTRYDMSYLRSIFVGAVIHLVVILVLVILYRIGRVVYKKVKS